MNFGMIRQEDLVTVEREDAHGVALLLKKATAKG